MTERRDPLLLIEALTHPNVQAFLRMLRLGEGTAGEDGYRTLFGGGLFDSFADHPRQRITRTLGGQPITSSAAGAYQFLERTWDALVRQYGFTDFSPKNQDLAAVALIAGRAALADVLAGRLEAAITKCGPEWASLPGAPYGQPTVSLLRVREEYRKWGGRRVGEEPPTLARVEPTLAGVTPTPAGVTDSPETAQAWADHLAFDPLAQADIAPPPLASALTTFSSFSQEHTMAPFVLAALPALIELVPRLGKLFASDSPTAQRNVAAVEAVARVAKEAVGAANEQDLVERLAADPEARSKVKAAIEAAWFSIDEVGGGIAAAREANADAARAASNPGGVPFWHQPVFWVSAALMPLVYFVTVVVLTDPRFSPEVQSMVISTILAGGLGAVTGYWLGTSFSSQRKTELLKRQLD